MFIYIYKAHGILIFSCNEFQYIGTSSLLLRFTMLWWFGTHACAVLTPDAAVSPQKSSVLYG